MKKDNDEVISDIIGMIFVTKKIWGYLAQHPSQFRKSHLQLL